MFQIDPLSLIPSSLKQEALNTVVNFLADQAKKLAGEEISSKIKKLRSDAVFQEQFDNGLQRAVQCFAAKYETQDEDLVAAITADANFFKNPEIREALLGILKKPGSYLAEQQETMTRSFASVLPGRKNRERVDRAVIYLIKCLAEELWSLPELQPVYNLQFQRLTAEATRQQVDLQKAQLQALTSLNTGVREALLQLTDAIAERKLLPDECLSHSTWSKLLHNLPQPDYGHFVGRDEELKQISQLLLSKSRTWIIVIDGIGGIGKSALALEIAFRYLRNYAQIPTEERFEAIVWVSAKRTTLTSDGVITRENRLRGLGDIQNAIAITLQREDILRSKPEERSELIRVALSCQRTLLIIDNLETIDDDAVLNFLRELPHPTKAIVTTRHRIDIAYPIRLVGMPWQDTVLLIEEECKLKLTAINRRDARRLYDRTGGVPLAIVWSIAQIGYGYSVECILERLGTPTNDVTRFCFEGAFQIICETPAYHLLLAMALFETDANRDAVGFVADLPILDRDDGLVVLEKLSLINRTIDRFSLLPLTKVYIEGEYTKDHVLQLISKMENRWIHWYEQISQKYHRYWELEDSFDARNFQCERANLAKALKTCIKRQDNRAVLSLALGFSNGSYHLGYIEESIESSEYGATLARQTNEPFYLAAFLERLGLMYAWRDEFEKSILYLKEAETISAESDPSLVFEILDHLGAQYLRRRYFQEAREYFDKALAFAQQSTNIVWIARSYYLFGVLYTRMGNYPSARTALEKALALSQEHHLHRLACWIKNYLGFVAIGEHKPEEAEKYLSESLSVAIGCSDRRRIGRIKEALGKLERERGNQTAAKAFFEESAAVFRELGMHQDVVQITALASQG